VNSRSNDLTLILSKLSARVAAWRAVWSQGKAHSGQFIRGGGVGRGQLVVTSERQLVTHLALSLARLARLVIVVITVVVLIVVHRSRA